MASMGNGELEPKPDSLVNEVVKRYYTTTSSRSHKHNIEWYRHASKQKIRRIKQWLPGNKDSRILDLGCGCGELLYGLEQMGYRHLTGIDYCQEELDEARKFAKSTLIYGDAVEYLAKTNEKFDFIIAYNVLEHLQKDVLLEVLRNIRRVLNPGGSLVAMVPNAVCVFGSVTRYWDITHEMAFTANNWYQLTVLTGFESKPDIRECGPIAHGPASFARYLVWRFLRLFIKMYLFCEVASDRGGIYTQDMMVRLKVSERETP